MLAVIFFRTQAGSVFWAIAAPVLSVREQASSGIGLFFAGFSSKAALENHITVLQQALATTTAGLADRDALYQENVFLKSQFGRDANGDNILAAVLMRPPATPYDTLLIDAGSNNGVAGGDLVYAGSTVLIGRVSDVYAGDARVALFSAPGETYQAYLRHAGALNGTPLAVEGQGAGSMSAEVPLSTPAAVGDPVVFADIDFSFTGSISHIDAQEGASFETLYLQLPVDLFSLQYVEIRRDGSTAANP